MALKPLRKHWGHDKLSNSSQNANPLPLLHGLEEFKEDFDANQGADPHHDQELVELGERSKVVHKTAKAKYIIIPYSRKEDYAQKIFHIAGLGKYCQRSFSTLYQDKSLYPGIVYKNYVTVKVVEHDCVPIHNVKTISDVTPWLKVAIIDAAIGMADRSDAEIAARQPLGEPIVLSSEAATFKSNMDLLCATTQCTYLPNIKDRDASLHKLITEWWPTVKDLVFHALDEYNGGNNDELVKHQGHDNMKTPRNFHFNMEDTKHDYGTQFHLPINDGLKSEFEAHHPTNPPYKPNRSALGEEEEKNLKKLARGVNSKVVHNLPNGNKYMVKAYTSHEGLSQATYHAAGLGHIHQRSFTSNYSEDRQSNPCTVIKIEPGYETLADRDLEKPLKNLELHHKAGLLDMVIGHGDRHGDNLMSHKETDMPLRIDNEGLNTYTRVHYVKGVPRSFVSKESIMLNDYRNDYKKRKTRANLDSDAEVLAYRIHDLMRGKQYAGTYPATENDIQEVLANLVDWWPTVADKVKQATAGHHAGPGIALNADIVSNAFSDYVEGLGGEWTPESAAPKIKKHEGHNHMRGKRSFHNDYTDADIKNEAKIKMQQGDVHHLSINDDIKAEFEAHHPTDDAFEVYNPEDEDEFVGGINNKVIHWLPNGNKYMVKPYTSQEGLSQAVFHAAGMGEFHQKTFTSNYEDWAGENIKATPSPVTVVKIEPGLATAYEYSDDHGNHFSKHPEWKNTLSKMFLLDAVMGRSDRHGNNYMFNKETGKPLFIDNEALMDNRKIGDGPRKIGDSQFRKPSLETIERVVNQAGEHYIDNSISPHNERGRKEDNLFSHSTAHQELGRWWLSVADKVKHAADKNMFSDNRGIIHANVDFISEAYRTGLGTLEKHEGHDLIKDKTVAFYQNLGSEPPLTPKHTLMHEEFNGIHHDATTVVSSAVLKKIGGSRPKVVHKLPDGRMYMVKPYNPNEHLSQKVFHAAGMGDYHQKSFSTNYNTAENNPVTATVICMEPNHSVMRKMPFKEVRNLASKHAETVTKMSILDSLLGQADRHSENILFSNTGDRKPLFVDNSTIGSFDKLDDASEPVHLLHRSGQGIMALPQHILEQHANHLAQHWWPSIVPKLKEAVAGHHLENELLQRIDEMSNVFAGNKLAKHVGHRYMSEALNFHSGDVNANHLADEYQLPEHAKMKEVFDAHHPENKPISWCGGDGDKDTSSFDNLGGVNPKTVHKIGRQQYMVKPYSTDEGLSQKMFKAAGMGDYHQKSFSTGYFDPEGNGTFANVIKLERGYRTLSNHNMIKESRDVPDLRQHNDAFIKIQLLDYLRGATDRHSSNIMVHKKTGKPLAIDNEGMHRKANQHNLGDNFPSRCLEDLKDMEYHHDMHSNDMRKKLEEMRGWWDKVSPILKEVSETHSHGTAIAKRIDNINSYYGLTKSDGSLAKNETIPETVERAIRQGDITSRVSATIKAGKHTEGTLIAGDEEILLKPGSGQQNDTAGARDSSSSQTNREVAFYEIGKVMGIGDYLQEAQVVFVDSKPYAAIRMLPESTWKDMNKIDPTTSRRLFYLHLPELYKWAAVDWILGNADRNAGNVMSDGIKIKLIDHGSAFAGKHFAPVSDPNSWVPYYMRSVIHNGTVPKLSPQQSEELGKWLQSIDREAISKISVSYGIDPKPMLDRLETLLTSKQPEDATVRNVWGLR